MPYIVTEGIISTALQLGHQKPKRKVSATFSSDDLHLGTVSWLLRQPEYLQNMVSYVGVFSFQPQDLEAFQAAFQKHLEEPFATLVQKYGTPPVPATTSQWTCNKCKINNPESQATCALCSTPQKSDIMKPISTKPLSLKEESMLVYQSLQQPSVESQSHVFDIFFEAEKAQTYQMFEELKKEGEVQKIVASPSGYTTQPRYLFAFFKDKASARLLMVDKRDYNIEWFNPEGSDVSIPFGTDPLTTDIVPGIQAKIQNRVVPQDLLTILPYLNPAKTTQFKWLWNKNRNKQTKPGEQSDLYALWYLMMRVGYERKGGAQSPQQLDQTSMPFRSVNTLFSEFFQES